MSFLALSNRGCWGEGVAGAGAVGGSKAESKHWKLERGVSVALLAALPAAAVVGPAMPVGPSHLTHTHPGGVV